MTIVALVVASLNRNHDQYVGLYRRYQALARFLAGEGEAPLLTYPAWGYPWLLSVLPHPELSSILLQVALAVVTLLLARDELRRLGLPLRLVDLLCIGGIPWYALASMKLADTWAASLSGLGALLLVRALRLGDLRLVLASGVVFGIAANVRSELLGLVPFAALVALAVEPRRIRRDAPAWSIAAAVMLCLLLPWGWFRAHHGAPFGLTTTNSGMVLYQSLGFQGNAWGIVADDRVRKQEVREHLGSEVDPASAEASRWFRARAIAAIRERPLEYARKVWHNFLATIKFGFYGLEMEPMLSEQDGRRYEALKEQLKLLAGAKVNPLDVEALRRQGLWQDDFELRSVPPRLWAIAGLPLLNAALSATYLVALLGSLGWVLIVERRWLAEPLVRVMLGFTAASWSLLCLLQYEPRQANPLYFFGLPVVAIGGQALWQRWRRDGRAPARRAAAPAPAGR